MDSRDAAGRRSGFVHLLRGIFGRRGDAWFVGVALLLGLAAFAWAGFLANPQTGNSVIFPNNPLIQRIFFKEPWLLFVWYCLLILTVQLSVLFDPDLPPTFRPGQRKVIATLAVALVCIVGVIVARLSTGSTAGILNLAAWIGTHHALSLAALNLGLLAIFWASALLSHVFPASRGAPGERAAAGEGLIGDLLAGIVFALLLALIFIMFHLHDFSKATVGFVTWEDAACQLQHVGAPAVCGAEGRAVVSPTSVNFLSTLVFFNLVLQPILYAVFALILLTFTATVNAFERNEPTAFGRTFVEIGARIIRRFVGLADVTMRLRVFWPGFALLAFVSVGFSAEALQRFLYFEVNQKWHAYYAAHASGIAWVLWPFSASGLPDYSQALLAVLTGITALVAAVTAVALQIIPASKGPAAFWRASTYMRQHLRNYVLWLATSYWAFSLILSGLNQLGLFFVQFAAAKGWPNPGVAAGWITNWLYAPFIQPDPLMVLSFVAFLVVSVRSRRRARRETRREPVEVGVQRGGLPA